MADRFNRERRRRFEGDQDYGYSGRQRMERDYGRDYQQEGRFGRGDYDRGQYRGEGTGRGMGGEYGYYGRREGDYEEDIDYGGGYGQGGYERGYYGQGRGGYERGWGGYPGRESRSGSYGRAGGDFDPGTYDRGYGGYGYGRRGQSFGDYEGSDYGDMGQYGQSARFRGRQRDYESREQRYGGGYDRQQGYGYDRGYRGRSDFGGYGSGVYGGSSYGQDMESDFDDMPDDDTSYWTYSEVWFIPGPYTGAGPQGYQRSDERIHEDVCERLTRHGQIDASGIQIEVQDGNVILRGSVNDRQTKRKVEDVIEQISGVKDVQNDLRVQSKMQNGQENRQTGQMGKSHSGTLGNEASRLETGSATRGSTTSTKSSVTGERGSKEQSS